MRLASHKRGMRLQQRGSGSLTTAVTGVCMMLVGCMLHRACNGKATKSHDLSLPDQWCCNAYEVHSTASASEPSFSASTRGNCSRRSTRTSCTCLPACTQTGCQVGLQSFPHSASRNGTCVRACIQDPCLQQGALCLRTTPPQSPQRQDGWVMRYGCCASTTDDAT